LESGTAFSHAPQIRPGRSLKYLSHKNPSKGTLKLEKLETKNTMYCLKHYSGSFPKIGLPNLRSIKESI